MTFYLDLVIMRCLRTFLRAKKSTAKAQLKQAPLAPRPQLSVNLEQLQPQHTKLTESQASIEPLIPAFPPHFAKLCILGELPGFIGGIGMFASDLYSPAFHTYSALTGTWLGTNLAFLGGSVVGFEVMKTHPDLYTTKSTLYTKARLWFGLAHLPLFLVCLWSSANESWKGYISVSIGIGVSCVGSFSTVANKTIPLWFSRFILWWAVYNCGMSMLLTYFLFKREETLRQTI